MGAIGLADGIYLVATQEEKEGETRYDDISSVCLGVQGHETARLA
jgi:hypothetical protein